MSLMLASHVHLHFVVYDERIQTVSTHNELHSFSDDSSERLWLAIGFINSTELCVIGYTVQHLKMQKKKYDWTNKP